MSDYYNDGWICGYEQGVEDERPKAFSDGYEAGYRNGKKDAIVVYKEMVLAEISDAINRGEEKVVLGVFLDKVAKQLKREEK